jgi:hypothetical protein
VSFEVIQAGDPDEPFKKVRPRTNISDSRGVVRYSWVQLAVGRTAKYATLQCAYRLGYTDKRMSKEGGDPPTKEFYQLFQALLPWFEDHYNEWRLREAADTGKLPGKLYHKLTAYSRLRCMFRKPGGAEYAMSSEHPEHDRHTTGARSLRPVMLEYSREMKRRLYLPTVQPITIEEAEYWGRWPR